MPGAISSQYVNLLLYFGTALVLYLLFMFFLLNKRKKAQTNYAAANPDSAKVYLKSKSFIFSEAVTVHSINDEAPVLFTEKSKTGFYARPGTNIIKVSYSRTRPGFLYKSITKSTGITTKTILIEAKKLYMLGFDCNTECFIFSKLNTI